METEKTIVGTDCKIGDRYWLNREKSASGVCVSNTYGNVVFNDIIGKHTYEMEDVEIPFIKGYGFSPVIPKSNK